MDQITSAQAIELVRLQKSIDFLTEASERILEQVKAKTEARNEILLNHYLPNDAKSIKIDGYMFTKSTRPVEDMSVLGLHFSDEVISILINKMAFGVPKFSKSDRDTVLEGLDTLDADRIKTEMAIETDDVRISVRRRK